MSGYFRNEIKIATIGIAGAMFLLGIAIVFPHEKSIFNATMEQGGLGAWWGFVLIGLSGMLVYGAWFPSRQIRHVALALAMISSMVTFSPFVFQGMVTLPSLVIVWFGLMALACHAADVVPHAKQKLRERDERIGAAVAKQ